ncbi:MAG: hypothetical protein AAGD06_22130 [Acidobacteriota bacterium]
MSATLRSVLSRGSSAWCAAVLRPGAAFSDHSLRLPGVLVGTWVRHESSGWTAAAPRRRLSQESMGSRRRRQVLGATGALRAAVRRLASPLDVLKADSPRSLPPRVRFIVGPVDSDDRLRRVTPAL